MDHEVAIVGDELERHGVPALVGEGHLEEPRHARVQDAEAVFARQDLEVRGVGEVDHQEVAQARGEVEYSVVKSETQQHDEGTAAEDKRLDHRRSQKK